MVVHDGERRRNKLMLLTSHYRSFVRLSVALILQALHVLASAWKIFLLVVIRSPLVYYVFVIFYILSYKYDVQIQFSVYLSIDMMKADCCFIFLYS